jgi:hypothetical protein
METAMKFLAVAHIALAGVMSRLPPATVRQY